jgi:hypothetical protein
LRPVVAVTAFVVGAVDSACLCIDGVGPPARTNTHLLGLTARVELLEEAVDERRVHAARVDLVAPDRDAKRCIGATRMQRIEEPGAEMLTEGESERRKGSGRTK